MSKTFEDYIAHLAHILEEHSHSAQIVRPTGAVPITVTSGGAAWTLGVFSNDIIAAADIASPFDLHWVIVSAPSANAEYEIVMYYGAADTECCRVAFTRTNVFVASIAMPTQTIIIPASSRIRAKMMDSVGGGTANVRVFLHTY